MRTNFSARQLADSDTAEANKILRACVHCGFCNATCPTYLLLGDELDGPRGRIYLIKDMLENDRPATKQIATHIDRCLSCLACMTTCPSGVHYMHLVDQGRAHVEATYRRPLHERLLRDFLAFVLPRPAQFRRAMQAARLARPFAALLPGRLGSMLRLAPRAAPDASRIERPQLFPAEGVRRKRVALLAGCVQTTLAPSINAATVRLLNRHGCEVVVAEGAGCCGALTHHLGKDATAYVKANVDSWLREVERGGLDAVVVNASGCGTMVKDYGYLLRSDPAYAAKAAKVSALARDVSEFMAELGLRQPAQPTGQRVAYHAACSLQHGQRVIEQPKQLLGQAGFQVVEVPEGHICCGSAGTYNMLEPEIATQLRDRKVRHIASVAPDIVAAGNIGCITQIAAGMAIPVVHTVELLDWATGGPKPAALA
ncbi:MAG TPA: glycolate oxidase subunit GlcF [Stellaceae bacterium]|nr:glycolate oxidase subunit GlcF [Stellaceae bacterium]